MTETTDADSPTADDRQKLHWEIEKLRAETENIRRPAYRSPATLVPMLTELAALVGVGFQYQRNALEADRAAWRKEVIEHQITQLQDEKTKLTAELEMLARDNLEASTRLERIRMDLAEVEATIQTVAASTAESSPAKDAVLRAQSTLTTLQETTSEAARAQATRAERLGDIRSRVERVDPAAIRNPASLRRVP